MYSVVAMAAFAMSPMDVEALLPGRNARIEARAAASCGGFEAGVFRVRRAGVGAGAGCGGDFGRSRQSVGGCSGFEGRQQFAVKSGGCSGFQAAPQQQRYQLVPVPAEQSVPLPQNPTGAAPPTKKVEAAAPPQQFMLVAVPQDAAPPKRTYYYNSFGDCPPGSNCYRNRF